MDPASRTVDISHGAPRLNSTLEQSHGDTVSSPSIHNSPRHHPVAFNALDVTDEYFTHTCNIDAVTSCPVCRSTMPHVMMR